MIVHLLEGSGSDTHWGPTPTRLKTLWPNQRCLSQNCKDLMRKLCHLANDVAIEHVFAALLLQTKL